MREEVCGQQLESVESGPSVDTQLSTFVDLPVVEIVDEAPATATVAQGDYDGSAKQTASPVFTAIMSGRVGISGREF